MKEKLNLAAIVLAAGLGTRMKSQLSKVLHVVGGKTIIERTAQLLKSISPRQIIVVCNRGNLAKIKSKTGAKYDYAIQKKPQGTADAAQTGVMLAGRDITDVAILNGDDNIFYKPQTIKDALILHKEKDATITFITLKPKSPQGLGRVIRRLNKVKGIVEEKDAKSQLKKIKEVNGGFYFFKKDWFLKNVKNLVLSEVTHELYITDLIKEASSQGEKIETYLLADTNQYFQITTKADLKKAQQILKKRIHIMGVAGSGASAVAGIAKAYGWQVTGCDLKPQSAYSQNLKDIALGKGHSPTHLVSIGQLIVSPAVLALDPQNAEFIEAKRQKIPIATWQEFQGKYLQKDKFTITVAGAYGKSTTTAMISQILIDAGLDPTCEVGASILGWDANFRVGKSKYYICEADEYNDNFLNYQGDIAVVLNLAWDHPDYFKNRQQLVTSYQKFIEKIKPNGVLVVADDPKLVALTKQKRDDIHVVKVGDFGPVNLKIIGDFRNENAQTALTVARLLNLDLKLAKKSLSNFSGLGRRLEFKGEINGIKVYDDYAVQPYTVMMTANALCQKFPAKKVVLVFEPHTFSRIETFFDDFVKSLKSVKVDKILVTDVYAAREIGNKVALSRKLVEAIGNKAVYSGSLKKTAEMLRENLNNYDVILSMGAGDVYKIYVLLKKFYG